MAKFGRFTDAEVTINAVDLSSFVRSVSLESTSEILDSTAMSDTTRVKVAGLKDWTITCEFFHSFYTAEIDATLWPLYDNQSTFTITVMPNKTAGVSATNPKYTGTAILPTYQPIAGTYGELLTSNVTFESAGALTRAVA